eukprot:817168-Amorphochlora_amoeboformis.AAC.1
MDAKSGKIEGKIEGIDVFPEGGRPWAYRQRFILSSEPKIIRVGNALAVDLSEVLSRSQSERDVQAV